MAPKLAAMAALARRASCSRGSGTAVTAADCLRNHTPRRCRNPAQAPHVSTRSGSARSQVTSLLSATMVSCGWAAGQAGRYAVRLPSVPRCRAQRQAMLADHRPATAAAAATAALGGALSRNAPACSRSGASRFVAQTPTAVSNPQQSLGGLLSGAAPVGGLLRACGSCAWALRQCSTQQHGLRNALPHRAALAGGLAAPRRRAACWQRQRRPLTRAAKGRAPRPGRHQHAPVTQRLAPAAPQLRRAPRPRPPRSPAAAAAARKRCLWWAAAGLDLAR